LARRQLPAASSRNETWGHLKVQAVRRLCASYAQLGEQRRRPELKRRTNSTPCCSQARRTCEQNSTNVHLQPRSSGASSKLSLRSVHVDGNISPRRAPNSTARSPPSQSTRRRSCSTAAADRQANSALHTVALTRMRTEPRTRSYVAKRTAQGLSKREIMRCLKRYIARDLYPQIRLSQPA